MGYGNGFGERKWFLAGLNFTNFLQILKKLFFRTNQKFVKYEKEIKRKGLG